MFYPKWMAIYGVSDKEISIVYTALLAGGQFGGMVTVWGLKTKNAGKL